MDDLSFEEFFQVNPGLNEGQNVNSANTNIDTKQQNNINTLLLKGILISAGIFFCFYYKDEILAFIFGKRQKESEPEDF